VWISHAHGDHYFGVFRILEVFARDWEVGDPQLLVVGPTELRRWIHAHASISQNTRLRDCYSYVTCAEMGTKPDVANLFQARFKATLSNVRVNHCADAWGLVFRHNSGYKLVYSGDTQYCEALVDAGRAATVLIHEATFSPDRADEASFKSHSTILDAVLAGERMKAERVILTHFSTRKLVSCLIGDGPTPPDFFDFKNLSAWDRSIPAFDCVEFKFKQLESLPDARRQILHVVEKSCEQ
jgi:ribonuclease Z